MLMVELRGAMEADRVTEHSVGRKVLNWPGRKQVEGRQF